MKNGKYKNLTAVLVHAAWADASSWNKVTSALQVQGFKVRSAQIPLTSLSDDVAALKRLLKKVEGPVLLVGHSYAGAVITAAATNEPNIKALVYIAAIAPDENESVGMLFQRAEPNPNTRPQIAPDADGFLWLPVGAFAKAVAPDASSEETALMDINQHPIALKCLAETVSEPAWKQKPSWFLLATRDRMISPDTQRFMAERIGARIHALDVDHTPLASAPESVARIVVEAADATI
ncbi:MAG TPA: alpha/beta hydrolase [Candidatus Sulfotelmatobacter sp.]|nr:alpha/beta hydrolase [Candidatus Sulfotelmatobacter sp.]